MVANPRVLFLDVRRSPLFHPAHACIHMRADGGAHQHRTPLLGSAASCCGPAAFSRGCCVSCLPTFSAAWLSMLHHTAPSRGRAHGGVRRSLAPLPGPSGECGVQFSCGPPAWRQDCTCGHTRRPEPLSAHRRRTSAPPLSSTNAHAWSTCTHPACRSRRQAWTRTPRTR